MTKTGPAALRDSYWDDCSSNASKTGISVSVADAEEQSCCDRIKAVACCVSLSNCCATISSAIKALFSISEFQKSDSYGTFEQAVKEARKG